MIKINLDEQFYKPKTEGFEDVEITVKPLSTLPMLELSNTIQEAFNTPDKKLARDGLLNLVEVSKKILPEFVTGINGITIVRDGKDHNATIEDVISVSQLWVLIPDLIFHLLEISRLTRPEEKNSDGLSVETGQVTDQSAHAITE